MTLPLPSILGLKKSFGFGDRLGLATPGHAVAVAKTDFAPIFAQQSVREMERAQRTPAEVMRAAQTALDRLGWTQPWGADADHHKTADEVRRSAAAGFTFFTIDPSAFVLNAADQMTESELARAIQQQHNDGVWDTLAWEQRYLDQPFDLGAIPLRFSREQLHRAAVKYARAIHHTATMAAALKEACGRRPFEIELAVDETDSATSPLDHLFIGLELKRRKIPHVVSVAPRFVGEFESGIDYRGDLKEFERHLSTHVAIATFCGPYKISLHTGSDKFMVYPMIGRVCGELLHVKTAGTSYLEALRVVSRVRPELFAEIAAFARGRFPLDRQSYHISTTPAEIDALPPFHRGAAEEARYLDERVGRQLLHVTFGSVLARGHDSRGRRFKTEILGVLQDNADLYLEFLEAHFDKHLRLLNKG